MLAYWLAMEKDALICDLAETYRIYDWRSVPVFLLATLVSGLGENSRIGKIRDGRKVSIEAYYTAELCDMLETLIMGLSGKESTANRTETLLIQKEVKKETTYTVEEFEKLRSQIMKG